tara:strand:- start:2473 stop:2574 length:102 start_codon:yes stop_codon:yes gene_type:complete
MKKKSSAAWSSFMVPETKKSGQLAGFSFMYNLS